MVCLARNEGMDPDSRPYITITIVVSTLFSIPSFPANQRPVLGRARNTAKGLGFR